MVWDPGDFDLLFPCFWCLPLEKARGNGNGEGMLNHCLVCLSWH